MQSDSRPSPRETPAPRRGLQNLKPVAPSLVPHTRARDARDARCARARCLRVISVAWTRARCERDATPQGSSAATRDENARDDARTRAKGDRRRRRER